MSSISSVASARPSPLELLQNELASEVSSGAVGASDQQALSTALKDVDSTLSSQTAQASSSSSPADMQSKIETLIDGEVDKGTLTTAQASELKNIFSNALQAGGGGPGADGGTDTAGSAAAGAAAGGGPGAGGGSGGAGGAVGGGGGTKKSSSTDPADANGDGNVTAAEQAAYDAKHPVQAMLKKQENSATVGNSGSTSELVSKFLGLVQDTQKGSANYDANGDSLASQIRSLIVNYQA
jgi:hypothetical protein